MRARGLGFGGWGLGAGGWGQGLEARVGVGGDWGLRAGGLGLRAGG